MTDETAESIAHPVAFGTAMLVMFINWMVIGPPDGSAWTWVEHLGADLFVLALMAVVAESTSRVRSAWWSILQLKGRTPSVRRAAESVRAGVNGAERPHRAAAQISGFLAAAGAFAIISDQDHSPLLMLGFVLGAFALAQVIVMFLLRPRAEAALRRALEAARVGLDDADQLGLSEELGVERE